MPEKWHLKEGKTRYGGPGGPEKILARAKDVEEDVGILGRRIKELEKRIESLEKQVKKLSKEKPHGNPRNAPVE